MLVPILIAITIVMTALALFSISKLLHAKKIERDREFREKADALLAEYQKREEGKSKENSESEEKPSLEKELPIEVRSRLEALSKKDSNRISSVTSIAIIVTLITVLLVGGLWYFSSHPTNPKVLPKQTTKTTEKEKKDPGTSNTKSGPGSANSIDPMMELIAMNHRHQGDELIIEGVIKNISHETLEGVSVVVTFYDREEDKFLTTSSAPIEYTLLAPDEESPFKVETIENILSDKSKKIGRFKVTFKSSSGAQVKYNDTRESPRDYAWKPHPHEEEHESEEAEQVEEEDIVH